MMLPQVVNNLHSLAFHYPVSSVLCCLSNFLFMLSVWLDYKLGYLKGLYIICNLWWTAKEERESQKRREATEQNNISINWVTYKKQQVQTGRVVQTNESENWGFQPGICSAETWISILTPWPTVHCVLLILWQRNWYYIGLFTYISS